jgi:hypothetical protein
MLDRYFSLRLSCVFDDLRRGFSVAVHVALTAVTPCRHAQQGIIIDVERETLACQSSLWYLTKARAR